MEITFLFVHHCSFISEEGGSSISATKAGEDGFLLQFVSSSDLLCVRLSPVNCLNYTQNVDCVCVNLYPYTFSCLYLGDNAHISPLTVHSNSYFTPPPCFYLLLLVANLAVKCCWHLKPNIFLLSHTYLTVSLINATA